MQDELITNVALNQSKMNLISQSALRKLREGPRESGGAGDLESRGAGDLTEPLPPTQSAQVGLHTQHFE